MWYAFLQNLLSADHWSITLQWVSGPILNPVTAGDQIWGDHMPLYKETQVTPHLPISLLASITFARYVYYHRLIKWADLLPVNLSHLFLLLLLALTKYFHCPPTPLDCILTCHILVIFMLLLSFAYHLHPCTPTASFGVVNMPWANCRDFSSSALFLSIKDTLLSIPVVHFTCKIHGLSLLNMIIGHLGSHSCYLSCFSIG